MGDGRDLPLGLANGGDNFLRGFLILYFDVCVIVLNELGFEERQLPSVQHGVDGPILLRHKRANGFLALDDQPQRHSLHATCRQAAADLVPQKRRDFVAHQPVEDTAGLLRVNEIGVHSPGVVKRGADGFGRDFVKGHAEDFLGVRGGDFACKLFVVLRALSGFSISWFFRFRGLAVLSTRGLGLHETAGLREHHRQVRGNGLSLAVRVRGQIDGFRTVCRLA